MKPLRFSTMSTSLIVTCLMMASTTASAGPYRAVEGDIYVFLTSNTLSIECLVAASRIRSTLNDSSKPATYVPSTVDCVGLTADGADQTTYLPIIADTCWPTATSDPERERELRRKPSSCWAGRQLTPLPAGYYDAVRIHVTDYYTPAVNKKGAGAVSAGQALGFSIDGRVNAAVIWGLWETFSKNGFAFFVLVQ